ncbi:MAG: NYN domain-containing protein, partial [Acidimicrobiales bacterium]
LRAGESVEAARRDLVRAESALAEERRLRRAAEQESARLGRVTAAAEDQATSTAAELASVRSQLHRLSDETHELNRQLVEVRAEVRAFPDPAPAAAALASARAAANSMAEVLSRSLDEVSALLRPAGRPLGPAAPPPLPPLPPLPPSGALAVEAPAARRPLAIPPAVFDDSPAAAAHLVRAPGALLLVDGYNAAMAIWPGLDVTEVRLRLIDALVELAARTTVAVHVVFDGAELSGGTPPARSTGPVRVSFSDPDVEADDVILDLVGTLPATRPVLVASSDRRVQDGARRLGANVISSSQLGAVLGR